MAEYKKIEDGKAELSCSIKGEEWENAVKKAFDKLVKKLDIKGFRKGQVPASLAKKYISKEACWYEAVDELSNDAFKAALDEHNVDLIDQASMDLKGISEEGVDLVFTCPIKPDVTLGDYKSLKYNLEKVEVSDEEVNERIDSLREKRADLELKEDGTVEDGDVVVIDFNGFKDGKAFDGGKAENYELTIGSHTFVPGFEEQLIGLKSEEEKDIDITFPEDYHADELKGAKVVFKVTVHEIKKKVIPSLDDEYVASRKIENVNTVDEYKAYVKSKLLENKEEEAKAAAEKELVNAFDDQCSVNIPQSMLDKECEDMINEQAQRLAYQGISFDQYLSMIGSDIEKLKKELEPEAAVKVKSILCLEELAKKEGIEASQEGIDEYYKDMAKAYGMEVEDVKKYVTEDTVKYNVKLKTALDLLKNNK